MIEAIGLNKHYGPHHAVKDVSFFIEPGLTVGFLGGNGAGKSTTMRLLTGFLRPSSGTARIAGIDICLDPVAARRNLGYLPESNPLYPDMRVSEFLEYRARLKGIARCARRSACDAAVQSCWLTDVRERMIGHLSKGYRQRVGLADCLLGNPKLLILDEPTVGLDPNQVRETRELIRHLGQERTVFLSTHILHEVELVCSEVIIIHQGAIVARGKTRDLCERYDGPRRLTLRLNSTGAGASGVEYAEEEAALRRLRALTELNRDATGRWLMTCEGDPRREIARLAGDKGWLVEEMTLEPVRLEEIFSRLTLPTSVGYEQQQSADVLPVA